MNIVNIIKSLSTRNKQVNLKELPSQGLFYPDDMKMYIGKCTKDDIASYKEKIDPSNVMSMVNCMQTIINKCVTMNKNYDTSHIKSVDMAYLLFEIVKHTTGKAVTVEEYDNTKGMYVHLPIDKDTFNYFDLSSLMCNYLNDSKEFSIDGYRLSIPSKGVETSLGEYFYRIPQEKCDKITDYSYDFIYFLGNRNYISTEEIETLIDVFNDSMDQRNKDIVSNLVKTFSPMIKYSLIYNDKIVDLPNKIKLANIWD